MVAALIEVANKTFDYVIVGGGTAGLALATLLSSDTSISVAVLEAGKDVQNDPLVNVPGMVQFQLTDPKYDWTFHTTPQKYCNDRSLLWSRGKMLGGSSNMNLHRWITPPAYDVNMIEKLGNPGWNWNEFAKYARRSEMFIPASEEQMALYPYDYVPEYHGTDGSIKTSITLGSHFLDRLFGDTLVNMGSRKIKDPYNGDITGAFISHGTVDPKGLNRVSSVNGYYYPVQDRSNLVVLTDATVVRILFEETSYGSNYPLTAVGAEFVYEEHKHMVQCRKELIMSAGAIKNPQILELSGIGSREILEKIKVDVKVELPGVGENVQEHLSVSSTYELNPGNDLGPHRGLMKNPDYAATRMKLHAEGKGLPFQLLSLFTYVPLQLLGPGAVENLIKKAETDVEEFKKSGKPALAEQYDIELVALRDPTLPDCEMIPVSYIPSSDYDPQKSPSCFTVVSVLNHPFSRGSIHAKSDDPLEHPEIDPHIFEFDHDLQVLIHTIRLIRKMMEHEPFKSAVARELSPGLEAQTDEQLGEWIKSKVSTMWHTVGSCSMLPRDKQGVVSPDLIVYGTRNVRVVDISIIPLHLSTHTQSVAFAIAEKAADLIRGI